MQEIIYYANAQNGLGAVDLHTGGHVSSFKGNGSPLNGMTVTKNHIVAAQSGKALIHVYSHTKESIFQKIVAPEHISSICISSCNNWLAAGGVSGRIFVWDLGSGRLWFARECHYQAITSLEFSSDSSILVSASLDARIFVWRLLDLVSSQESGAVPAPLHTFSDHTLSVTKVCIGKGKFNEARIVSCSLDGTVRLYDAVAGSLLTTFIVPQPVHSIALDPAERTIYAGTQNGGIYIIPLYKRDVSTNFIQAVGGSNSVISINDSPDVVLSHHTKPVQCLSLSFDAVYLVSGDEEGQLVKWDLSTNQLETKYRLATVSGAISSIHTMIVPTAAHPIQGKKVEPDAIPQLKRTIGDKAHDVYLRIPQTSEEEEEDIEYPEPGTINTKSQGVAVAGDNARIRELEQELDSVHRHFNALKEAHDQLWRNFVSKSASSST